MRCGRAQKLMTAAVDGELSAGRRAALDRHLVRCTTCRAEYAATGRMLRALDLLPTASVVPDAVERATLRRVHALAAEEAERAGTGWWRGWFALPAVAIATAAVITFAVGITRRTDEVPAVPSRVASTPPRERVAKATPPAFPDAARRAPSEPASPPPAALAQAPDLFVDLPMLRNLDKLRHFEAIQTTTLDDDTPSGEESPSNG